MKRLLLGMVVLGALCVDLPGTLTDTAATAAAAPVVAQPAEHAAVPPAGLPRRGAALGPVAAHTLARLSKATTLKLMLR